MSPYRKHLGIAVGIDESPPSKVAVDCAARDAQLRNLPLTVVHAIPTRRTLTLFRLRGELPYSWAHQIIDDAGNVVSESTSHGSPIVLNTIMMFADPVAALVELSSNPEMIVVESRAIRLGKFGLGAPISVPGCDHQRRRPADAASGTGPGALAALQRPIMPRSSPAREPCRTLLLGDRWRRGRRSEAARSRCGRR